jgi:G3E family GTPase
MHESPAKLPVMLITGFLGSGKTTLLRHLLHHPAMADTAVVVNELGEVGLDHHLLEIAEGEVVVMSSGCLCCMVRSDLGKTLSGLFERRSSGTLGQYRRVLIETTGLADPAPILHTLMQDPLVTRNHELDVVITTVDAIFGESQLDRHIESAKQAAVADRLLITKTDVVAPEVVEELSERLRSLNPSAPLIPVVQGQVDPAQLFGGGLHDLATRTGDVRRWLGADAHVALHAHERHRHDESVEAHCLVYDEPINWRYFSPNLASLISRHAEKLLRVKGLLNVDGEPAPVVVHGVQHQFQRLRLEKWPDEDRRSKLVLITRGLKREFLADWLRDDRLA